MINTNEDKKSTVFDRVVQWVFYITVILFFIVTVISYFDPSLADARFCKAINWLVNRMIRVGGLFAFWVILKVISGEACILHSSGEKGASKKS
jgi:hypothetical protein